MTSEVTTTRVVPRLKRKKVLLIALFLGVMSLPGFMIMIVFMGSNKSWW